MDEASGSVTPLPGLGARATLIYPNDEDTADCSFFCTADDGSDYAVKDQQTDARIPHSEWFCTKLGERVGLVSPPCEVIWARGEACFGSRWETEPVRDWWVLAKAKEIAFAELAGGLSRILAFDLFVHNDDRHLNNYLVRRQRTKHTVFAYDYSRAWLCNGVPPPPLPMAPDTRTIARHRLLKIMFGDFLSLPDVMHVTTALRAVETKTIEQIILHHPENWLTEREKSAIIDWWKSPGRLARIEQIEGGIADGSLL